MVSLSQFPFWVIMGITGPNEMGYRRSVTPDGLHSLLNTTIRSQPGRDLVGLPLVGFLASRSAIERRSGSASPDSPW